MYRVTRTIIPEDELMWNSPRFLIAIVGFALWVSVGSVSAAPQELTEGHTLTLTVLAIWSPATQHYAVPVAGMMNHLILG